MPRRSHEYMQSQRLRFCEAAMACFGRKGVTGSNLTDICDETGLSMGALYKHFNSREELLEAVLQLRLSRRNELLFGKTWFELKRKLVLYRKELEQGQFWREFEGVVDRSKGLTQLRVREGHAIIAQLEKQLASYVVAGEIEPPFDLNRTAQLISVIFDGSLSNVRSSSELSVDLVDFKAYLDLAVGNKKLAVTDKPADSEKPLVATSTP